MALNTVTTTSSVGQIDRSNPAITTNTKVANDSSAPFQPQTQVSIENSMKDMLTMLSKTALSEEISIQQMPVELQRVVNNILQNAFSLGTSISQGLSNTLQGQKAGIDQLNLLSKLLEQLSIQVSTNGMSNLSDTFITLLANTKLLDGQEGKILDSTALNKIAMQLLDGKLIENMPEVLQTFLIQNNQSNTMVQTQQPGSNMNFLKQLIKQLMPGPQENQSTAVDHQNNTTFNTTQATMNENTDTVNSNTNAQGNHTTKQMIANTGQEINTNSIQDTNEIINQKTAQKTPENINLQKNIPQKTSVEETILNKTIEINLKIMEVAEKETTKESMPEGANRKGSENLMKSQGNSFEPEIQEQNNSKNSVMMKAVSNNNQDLQDNTLSRNSIENDQQNKTSLPMQNTATTMQVMKNLASQILSDKELSLSTEEFGILKNFVNDKKQVLNECEVKNLQTLIKMSEENLPATIRQAAIRQKLPDLPKLWSFVQLCDLAQLTDLPANKLKNASKSISDFAGLLKESMQNENEVNGNQNQRSMSFMTPLYFGDNEHCYPTYIHVYNQTKDGRDIEEKQKETWFRICLLTENLGAVELVFRLYEKSKLNLRVTFSDDENVKYFNECMPEIEKAFKEMPLDLTDVKVSAIGG